MALSDLVMYNPYLRNSLKAGTAYSAAGLQRNWGQTGQRIPGRSRLSGSNTLTFSRRKRKPFAKGKSFAHKLLQLEPAKHYANSSLTGLTHNTIYTVIPTTGIIQGDDNTTRTGDFIHLAALKIRMSMQTATAAAGYTYRVLVGYTGEEYNLPTVLGAGLSSSELFIPNTAATWTPNGVINPKAFTCLYDETIDINSLVATVQDTQTTSFTVNLDKRFPYQAAASIYGKNQNLAVVVCGGVTAGVTGTTSVGSVVLTYDLIFKEI